MAILKYRWVIAEEIWQGDDPHQNGGEPYRYAVDPSKGVTIYSDVEAAMAECKRLYVESGYSKRFVRIRVND